MGFKPNLVRKVHVVQAVAVMRTDGNKPHHMQPVARTRGRWQSHHCKPPAAAQSRTLSPPCCLAAWTPASQAHMQCWMSLGCGPILPHTHMLFGVFGSSRNLMSHIGRDMPCLPAMPEVSASTLQPGSPNAIHYFCSHLLFLPVFDMKKLQTITRSDASA